jgi:DNA primase
MDPRAFVEAKLIRRRDDGSLCDTFRNRLMFPIHDRLGRVIAFGGRRIDEQDEPKYVNSTESRLFDKSATLYALPLASRAIQESRTAIVTEGYTDVIACHQAGFGNAVATLGTALTPKHVSLLGGLCKRVLLVFDSDEAGQLAADRATALLVPSSLEVAVVMLRDAKDPDEMLGRECGPASFAGALASAMSLREYRVNRVRARVLGGTRKSVALEEEIHAILDGLREAPPAHQRLVVQRLREIV